MVYSLTYRRPEHVASSNSSIISGRPRASSDESISSRGSSFARGIPDALSFDRIVAGGVCPPCTLRDFMNYLKYIEHAAENLQFYLWLNDYTRRFAGLSASDKALSPEWVPTDDADAANRPAAYNPAVAGIFKGTDFDEKKRAGADSFNPFHTPPGTPGDEQRRDDASLMSNDTVTSRTQAVRKAEDAFEKSGLRWQPFTVQPYREEVSRIIAIYVADGGPRQLNLSSKERAALLHALENTTHPSAFRHVAATVECSLRRQAHPNFIRWTICNGNRPRVVFARGLGVGGILAGIVTAVLLTMSDAGRGWRLMALIGFMIGIATLIAAWKGMCVVLHGMHHRHLRPWELFTDDDASDVELKNDSVDSLASSNSFEDEPWVAKYEKRNVIRKVFDREVWVQEPALRQIQDTIFVQALLGAFVLSAAAVGIFLAVPKGNLF